MGKVYDFPTRHIELTKDMEDDYYEIFGEKDTLRVHMIAEAVYEFTNGLICIDEMIRRYDEINKKATDGTLKDVYQ